MSGVAPQGLPDRGSAAGAPERRATWAREEALALLVASGAALVGLLMVVGTWLVLAVGTGAAVGAGDEPCLVAADTDPGVRVAYGLWPPRATCTRDVAGQREEVVLVDLPSWPVPTGAALALVGGAGTVVVLLRRRRTR